MSERTLFIGDVHGCIKELDGLLELAEFRSKMDRIFFDGDLINCGPGSLSVLKLAYHLRAMCE